MKMYHAFMSLGVSTSRDAQKVDQLPGHLLKESTNIFGTSKFSIKLISFMYEKVQIKKRTLL